MVMADEATLTHLLGVWDGNVVPLAALGKVITEAAASSDPNTRVERLWAAAGADLGDIPRALVIQPGPTSTETHHLARRLGWTVTTLIDWDPREDTSGMRIEAALASASAWDEAGSFWKAVRFRLEKCRVTVKAFEIVLRHREPRANIPDDAPIWEREHWHALQEAERASDWKRLGERAQAFRRLPHLDVCALQAALALVQLDWPCLVRLANEVKSWMHGHLLLGSLPLADALRLANASRSSHIRFAAMERVANREIRSLSPREETDLRNLLIVLSRNEDDWPSWLSICNEYPVRQPHIQAALGRALARSGGKASEVYVDSISLNVFDIETRDCVTRCLMEFRARAGTGRRRVLWHKAFDRWQSWNFAVSEGQILNAVARSALDYGVVGGLFEGKPREQTTDPEASFEKDLRALDKEWHSSLSAAASGFLRLVSRYQVFAHASSCLLDDRDWLPGTAVLVPHAGANSFVRSRYRWNGA